MELARDPPGTDRRRASDGKTMTPTDFKKLQDFIDNYCSQSIKEVLVELLENGLLKMDSCYKNSSAHINYSGYKLLMQNYIETDIPEDLLRNLFQDFLSSSWNFVGKGNGELKEIPLATKHSSKSGAKRETLTQFIRRLQDISKVILPPRCSSEGDEVDYSFGEEEMDVISVKELVCCLSLLEAGNPEDKLEFVFKIYDADGNGFLDAKELEHIVDQMTTLANNLEWDVEALKPILQRMIVSMDTNADGKVSLSEWKNAGLTTVPLLALLGMGTSDEGSHKFIMKHFKRPTYCNRCRRLLFGLRKQGLCCIYCKYTVHEQCAELEVLHGCIATCCSPNSTSKEINKHHWVEGNFTNKCSQCNKSISNMTGLAGQRCRWCRRTVHDNCQASVSDECDFGELRIHMLQPFSLCSTNPSCALDLQMKPIQGVCPLLVLINQKSGGKQGSKLMRAFQYLLNPRQVFDIGKGGPGPGLKFFQDKCNFKILCCGGDGTVGWVLEEMDKTGFSSPPPVAILPLGTGNDLARCLGWGGGYGKEDLKEILKLIEKSRIVKMDRWRLDVTILSNNSTNDGNGSYKIPNTIMNNYFSIGVDASIALRFHNMREKHPEKFSSRTRNKLWYFEFGTIETLRSTFKNLQENIEIECDDVPLNISDGMTLECIAVMNISSIYGGTDLWGSDGQRKEDVQGTRSTEMSNSSDILRDCDLARVEQDLGDGKLEVVGLESCIHLAQVKSGIQSGKRLCQCSKVTIRTKQKFPMQIDGEPWIQGPCQIVITHHNQASMLMSPVHSHG